MALTVLSIAFPFAPVGPSAVGGAEQILGHLDAALVAAGHTSLVVACQGSQAAGRLIAVPRTEREALEHVDKKQFQAAIDLALARYPVELVHMHGMDFHHYTLPAAVPVLVTLHMPIGWYPAEVWSRLENRAQFCCVSETQRRCCPAELRDVVVVENGVALPPFRAAEQRADFAVALGRICPEKNVHEAMQAGTLAGTRVLLGGEVFPYREHRQYFEEKIAPLIQEKRLDICHEFLGPLSQDHRRDLLMQAKCLLHPTLAPETSSLVAMEAAAVGTPVIAYRSGALPEIVQDGVTGFLVEGVGEMAEAIREAHTISAQACRETAERRFTRERMVKRYFELYHAMVSKSQLQRIYA